MSKISLECVLLSVINWFKEKDQSKINILLKNNKNSRVRLSNCEQSEAHSTVTHRTRDEPARPDPDDSQLLISQKELRISTYNFDIMFNQVLEFYN